MAKSVANVTISTDTFASWVGKTNILLDSLTNEIVTVDNTVSGANVSGNGSVLGILNVTTLGATTVRGGSSGNTANITGVSVGFANSTVSSNVTINGYTSNVASNTLNISSNTFFNNTNTSINAAGCFISGGSITVSSNSSLTGACTVVSSTNTALTGTQVNVSANVYITGSNTTIDGDIQANTLTLSGNTTVGSTLFFTGNTSAIVQTTGTYTFPGDGVTANEVSTFLISDFKTSKFTVSVSDNDNANNKLLTEITAVYANGNVNSTEYGTIFSDSKFMTFTFSSNTTHVILSGTSNSTVTNTQVTVLRMSFS